MGRENPGRRTAYEKSRIATHWKAGKTMGSAVESRLYGAGVEIKLEA